MLGLGLALRAEPEKPAPFATAVTPFLEEHCLDCHTGKRAAIKETGISELTAQDIADAVLYAVDAPWRVNVSLIELQPTEQVFGGMNIVPTD